MSFFRPNIDRMKGYKPGEQPKTDDFVKLNTNENPYPPSPKVTEALAAAVGDDLRKYPDPVAQDIRDRAARLHGVPPDCVLVGNGSDDLLTIAVRSFAAEGDLIAFPYPSYILYETLSAIQDAEPFVVDFPDDYSLPKRLVDASPALAFVCNPNSPSGTMASAEQVAELAMASRGIIVVDEAYVDFADWDCMELVNDYANVIVLRTLSKSYSLAGMRIGYAIGHENLIAGMMKVKDSYNMNCLSIVAGAAALDDVQHMKDNVAKIRKTRARLTDELGECGLHVFPSQANFVLARCENSDSARSLYEQLKERRILVRYFPVARLDDCLRITVGTDEEIDQLMKAIKELLGR